MTDRRKFFTILLVISLSYLTFYYQDEIVDFLRNPISSIRKADEQVLDNLIRGSESGEPTKVIYVDEENAVISVVERASPAVVSVVRKDVSFDNRRGPIELEDSIGTGFIIDGRGGIVLTNKHVVDEDNVSYSVVMSDRDQQFDVLQISRDPLNDFSILKIDTRNQTLPELSLGTSDNLKKGQTVIAIGNALGEFGNSVTKGIVSGLDRGILAQSGLFGRAEFLENVIQTDAALNPGNSGGPLLNLQGEVVGINVAVSRSAENIGFAIPIDTLKPALNQFREQGRISRPFLGVEYRIITPEIAEIRSLPVGAYVENVVSDSPASRAGIRQGDIITRINSIRLDDEDNTLAKVIARQDVNRNITIVLDRENREVSVEVRLEDASD